MNGAVFAGSPAVQTLAVHEVAHRIRALRPPPGRVFDLGQLGCLAESLPGYTVHTGDGFVADVCALPFANHTFAAVVGYDVLDRLQGSAIPEVILECARTTRLLLFVLTHDLLTGPVLRSTQQLDGSYVTEFGQDWFLRLVSYWPGRWSLRCDRFRVTTGAVITIWHEDP